ncbi:hypothetical protein GDO81_014680 [Engystomops pustulosus]|uniref:Uncharacterized protein n=1 Tax=Engystomops pustulosus TaxID=76066 RepID=A0AAV7BC00_ENGPU|nr:hypothetical protein GDO81_014680 [Engystomops pustulosus]
MSIQSLFSFPQRIGRSDLSGSGGSGVGVDCSFMFFFCIHCVYIVYCFPVYPIDVIIWCNMTIVQSNVHCLFSGEGGGGCL